MENIDDFMQRKFDSDDPAERFPFREEYWEQAQALIEADEQRRRKKRRFLFWWLFSGLLLGAGALWFWQDSASQHVAVSIDKSAGKSIDIAPASESGKNILPEAGSDMKSTERDLDKRVENSTENIDNKQVSGKNSGSDFIKNKQNSDKKTDKTTTPQTAINPTAITAKNAGQAPRKTEEKHPANTPKLSGINAKNSDTAPSPDKQQLKQLVETPALPTNSAINLSAGNSDQVVDKKAEKVAWLDVLNLPFVPAVRENQALPLKKMAVPRPGEIKPVSDKRVVWQAGISASSWQAGWGSTAGVFSRFKMRGPWSLGVGLNMRYQPLAPPAAIPDSSSLNVTVQYRYSFGVERTESRSTPLGMYSLELPLAAHWNRGRFGLEAGIAPGMLLLVKNRVTQTIETSLGGIQTGAAKTAWGEKSAFNKLSFNTFAMVECRLVPHVSLTLRGNYRPGSILKPAENTHPEKGLLGLDMGLRWQF